MGYCPDSARQPGHHAQGLLHAAAAAAPQWSHGGIHNIDLVLPDAIILPDGGIHNIDLVL